MQPVCEARLLEEYAVLRALTLDDRPAIELHRVRSRGGHPAQPYSGACPIEQDIRVFERRDMRARLSTRQLTKYVSSDLLTPSPKVLSYVHADCELRE